MFNPILGSKTAPLPSSPNLRRQLVSGTRWPTNDRWLARVYCWADWTAGLHVKNICATGSSGHRSRELTQDQEQHQQNSGKQDRQNDKTRTKTRRRQRVRNKRTSTS